MNDIYPMLCNQSSLPLPAWRRISQRSRRLLASCALLVLTGCATQPATAPADAPPAASQAPAAAAGTPQARPDARPVPDPVASATPEKIAALRSWVEQQSRLNMLAAPLLINNAPLCKRQARYLLGFTAKTSFSYDKAFVGAAQAGLGLDHRLRIMDVLPGSGAAHSGVQREDVLMAVEDQPLPQGAQAERAAAQLITAAMQNRSSLKLTLLRGSEQVRLDVPLTYACGFGIELGNSNDVNSFADGYRIMITRGMLAFASSDEELAYILAKEIAHGILTRNPRPRMRTLINSLQLTGTSQSQPALAMPAPYSPVLDATADKLSLYLLARAGYRLDNVIPFWKRLAAQYPASVARSHTALHPATAYRISVMTQVVQQIKEKQAKNLPLLPT